jgi:hypothetical protein
MNLTISNHNQTDLTMILSRDSIISIEYCYFIRMQLENATLFDFN